MSDQIFNLDDGVQEYTPFTLLGKSYKFRQFNTEEASELQAMSNDPERKAELDVWLEKFIIPVDGAPAFAEIKGKMLVGHYRNLNKMIYSIMGIDEHNKGTESSPAVPTE